MAKPTAYFPNTALPTLQELAGDSDVDNLGILGSITQANDQVTTSGYAAAGAISITVVGAFALWPAFGVVENLTTLEQMAFYRSDDDTLTIPAAGRARNGTTAAAGGAGQNLRFIEKRILGRWAAQIQAELVAHDNILRGAVCINEIINGNMDIAQLGGSALTTGTPAITAAQSYRLDSFFCRPAGAAVTVEQSTTVPNNDSEFSAQINGAASVTTVNFGQRFEGRRAKRLRRTVTFSAYVQNLSGADFTPKIQAYTPTALNNWAAVNAIQLDANLQVCANAAWTRVSFTVDLSGVTGITNGIEISIQFPNGSCVAGDTVRVTQFMLERGSQATVFSDRGLYGEWAACCRYRWVPGSLPTGGYAAGANTPQFPFWGQGNSSTTGATFIISPPVPMLRLPSVFGTPNQFILVDNILNPVPTGFATSFFSGNAFRLDVTVTVVAGRIYFMVGDATGGRLLTFDAGL